MHTFKITKTDDTGFAIQCEVGHYAPDGAWVVNKTTDGMRDAINLVRELNGGFPERELAQVWEFQRRLADFANGERKWL